MAPEPKHLLIVFHSQTGNARAMAEAVELGASDEDVSGVDVRLRRARAAGVTDLLWADALVVVTPENFGYMSGAMKDFFDRTFYPCQGRVESLATAIVISAGNDGTGALAAIRRIARGYPLREVQEPVIARGPVTDDHLARCRTLGTTLAAGLELGVF